MFDPFEHSVQYNECPSSTDSCTAVDNQVLRLIIRMDLSDSMDKVDDRLPIARPRDGMVWPS